MAEFIPWMQTLCSKCRKPHDDILVPCPHCGYQHPLTTYGKQLQGKEHPELFANNQSKKGE
jgi:hypothetical protein